MTFLKKFFSILTLEMESATVNWYPYQILQSFIQKLLRYNLLKLSVFQQKRSNFNMTTSLSLTSVEISKFCLACGIDLSWAAFVLSFTVIRQLLHVIHAFFMYAFCIFLQVERGFSIMTSLSNDVTVTLCLWVLLIRFCQSLLVYQVLLLQTYKQVNKAGGGGGIHPLQWYMRLLESSRNRVKFIEPVAINKHLSKPLTWIKKA